MTDKAISTAPHQVFERLARHVTENPMGEINDRLRDHSKRTRNGLERLLRAIEGTPVEKNQRRRQTLAWNSDE